MVAYTLCQMSNHYRPAAVVLYRLMTDAHKEHNRGELLWREKQYLWALALEVAERGRFRRMYQRKPEHGPAGQRSADLPSVAQEADLLGGQVVQLLESAALPVDERTEDPNQPRRWSWGAQTH